MTVRACGTVDAKTVDAKLPLMVADASRQSSAEQAGGLWCQFHDRQVQPACNCNHHLELC